MPTFAAATSTFKTELHWSRCTFDIGKHNSCSLKCCTGELCCTIGTGNEAVRRDCAAICFNSTLHAAHMFRWWMCARRRQCSACSPVALLPLVQPTHYSTGSAMLTTPLHDCGEYKQSTLACWENSTVNVRQSYPVKTRDGCCRQAGRSVMDISQWHSIWSATLLPLANYLSRVREMDLMCFPADTCSGSRPLGWIMAF